MKFFRNLLDKITTAKEKRDFAEYTQHVLAGSPLPEYESRNGYPLHDPQMN